jgi:POT family proton-dependent oligopeptide transporter
MIIILFAPVLNILWAWQARRGCETGSVSKMAIGCFLLGASFLIMIAGAQGVGPEDRRSVLWLLSTTFVFTIGELYLSPVGLSLVTKVAPARIVSTMMGVWFLSYFFGNYLSGFLGTFWEKMPRESFFCLLSMLGIAAGLAIWTLSKPLKAAVAAHE